MQRGHDDNKSFVEKVEAAAAVAALSNLRASRVKTPAGGATVPADFDAGMSVDGERNHQDIPSTEQPVHWQGRNNEATSEREWHLRQNEEEDEMKPRPTLRHHFTRSKLLYNDQSSANSTSESSTHTTNSSSEMNRLSSGYEGSKSAGSSDSLSAGDNGNGSGGLKHSVEGTLAGRKRCHDDHESDDLEEEYYSNNGKRVKFSIKSAHCSVSDDFYKMQRPLIGQYDEMETSGKGASLRKEYRSFSSSSSGGSCSDAADDDNGRKDSIDTAIRGDCGPAVAFARKETLDQSLSEGVFSRKSFPSAPTLKPANSGNASTASFTGSPMPEAADSTAAESRSITGVKSSESNPTIDIELVALKTPENEDEEMESADGPANKFRSFKTGSSSVTSSKPATKDATENTSFISEKATMAVEQSRSSKSKSTITKSPSISSHSGTKSRVLRPAPYYYYIDHSRDRDEDPTFPLSQPLYAPNFAAKMHAILIREELSNIITWMSHGRSWKIVNPDEFETKLLPVYFNHTKIASFYRQANGWGFRRMLKGSDKGSFYNENFLRGLPHLAKKMARTGGVKIVDDKKLDSNIVHEPNLWMISDEHPVPETVDKDTLSYAALKAINECILEGGPKARMPVLPSKRYKSDDSCSRLAASPSDQVSVNNSDEKQSSESSSKGTPNESGSSSHRTINSTANAMSSKRLPPLSQQVNTFLSLAQQHVRNDPMHSPKPKIPVLQQQQLQPQQQPLKHDEKQNIQQNQQVVWNNIAQDNAIMAFISSQILANASQQQQQQQQQLPNSFNNFPNPSLLNAGAPVVQVLNNFRQGQQNQPQQQLQQKQPSPQQQRCTVSFSQQSIDNSANNVAQQQQLNVPSNSNAVNDFLGSILTGWQQQQLLQRQQQQLSSDPSSATASLASSVSKGRRSHVDPVPHPQRQCHNPAHIPSASELERLMNSILAEHQQRGEQQLRRQQRDQQRLQCNNYTNGSMSASAVRELVAQAIILGAQFGAESVMNQNGSSSSDSNGNLDVSSDTA
mmetsp:Transcript_9632/g.19865  ORF Transcript_9632/g.19865 Transcript_9632/m.19865 type:complete len:1021 (+) Transcript_9632:140-3202(+)